MNPSGIRLGTPALTTRGLKEDDMAVVASFLHRGKVFIYLFFYFSVIPRESYVYWY